MTSEQRYIFNVSGYLHIKNLTPKELRNAQDAVKRYMNTPPEEMPVGYSGGVTTEASTGGYANAFAFDKALEHLVMHQATWPIIKELSADKPRMAPGGNSLRISTHENPGLPLHTLREPIHACPTGSAGKAKRPDMILANLEEPTATSPSFSGI